jgi:hypothetical protein
LNGKVLGTLSLEKSNYLIDTVSDGFFVCGPENLTDLPPVVTPYVKEFTAEKIHENWLLTGFIE